MIERNQTYRHRDNGKTYRVVRLIDTLLMVHGTWYNESRVVYADAEGRRYERFVSDFLRHFDRDHP